MGGGADKIVVTLYYFLGVPCLNFNHVIIMKDLHNTFAYYRKSKPKEVKCKKKITFFISYDVILKYILCRKKCHDVVKNANIFKIG
jgi:hypothetical protein